MRGPPVGVGRPLDERLSIGSVTTHDLNEPYAETLHFYCEVMNLLCVLDKFVKHNECTT